MRSLIATIKISYAKDPHDYVNNTTSIAYHVLCYLMCLKDQKYQYLFANVFQVIRGASVKWLLTVTKHIYSDSAPLLVSVEENNFKTTFMKNIAIINTNKCVIVLLVLHNTVDGSKYNWV